MAFDPSSFTTINMLMQMAFASPPSLINRGDAGDTREFTAYALHDSVPIGEKAYESFSGATSESDFIRTDITSRYQVFCMMVGDQEVDDIPAVQNPHNFNPVCGSDLKIQDAAKTLYTRCYTARDFVLDDKGYPQKGDRVKIRLRFLDDGTIDLSTGELVEIEERGEFVKQNESCIGESLAGLFAGTIGRKAGDPHETHTNVVYSPALKALPAYGYQWTYPDVTGNFETTPAKPGETIAGTDAVLVYAGTGTGPTLSRKPADGYLWIESAAARDYRVYAKQNTAGHRPTSFYPSSDTKEGDSYPPAENVVWTKDPITNHLLAVKPATGYVWSSTNKEDYTVKTAPSGG